jgi:hypothetical protein
VNGDANTKQLSPAGGLVLGGGATAFIFSFLPWLTSDFGDSVNAWNQDFPLMFPTFTLVGIVGLVLAVRVGVDAFVDVKVPPAFAGLRWTQWETVEGGFAAVLLLCLLVTEKLSAGLGVGYWLTWASTAAILVGSVKGERDRTNTSVAAAPPVVPPSPSPTPPPIAQPPTAPPQAPVQPSQGDAPPAPPTPPG